MKNPFRTWLDGQPRSVNMSSIARELDCDPSYISDLMSETNCLMPSLPMAFAIEDLTKGKVKARALHDFIRPAWDRKRAEERARRERAA